MSARIRGSFKNPLKYPNLFEVVHYRDVRRGDIFQGRSNPTKWYRNTDGQLGADSFRTYYRPKSASKASKRARPARTPVKFKRPAAKRKPAIKKVAAKKPVAAKTAAPKKMVYKVIGASGTVTTPSGGGPVVMDLRLSVRPKRA